MGGGDFNSLSVMLQTDRQRTEIGGVQFCQSSKHTYIHTHVCMYVCITNHYIHVLLRLARKEMEELFIFCEVPNCIR